jgi:hypothetical protein
MDHVIVFALKLIDAADKKLVLIIMHLVAVRLIDFKI